jgi:hypothetical protein
VPEGYFEGLDECIMAAVRMEELKSDTAGILQYLMDILNN